MKNYILLAMCLIGLTINSLASESNQVKSTNFNRLYIAGAPTYSSTNIKIKSNNNTTTYTGNGIGVTFHGGIGRLIYSNIYLGGELGLGLSGAHFNNKIYNSNNKRNSAILSSNSRFLYSMSAHIGYAFDFVLPYIKVGYEVHSSINVKHHETKEHITTLRRNSIILGGGADLMVSKNIFFRGEYFYNFGVKKRFGEFVINTPTHSAVIGIGYKI